MSLVPTKFRVHGGNGFEIAGGGGGGAPSDHFVKGVLTVVKSIASYLCYNRFSSDTCSLILSHSLSLASGEKD